MSMKHRATGVLAALAISLTALPQQAHALDAASVQAYCEAVKQAAKDAQKKYLGLFTPKVSPQDVFDRAVKVCSEYITKFDGGFKLSIPSLGDIQGMLEREAEKLLRQACQAAQDQFNRALDDAVRTVNEAGAPVTQVPGVNVDLDPRKKTGVGVDVGAAGSAAAGQVGDGLFNKIR